MPNRTRQRHVKQTQIFRQTFGLREVDAFWRSIKIQNSLKRVAIVIERLILDAEIGDKRQPDQWIFQPFRFVDRDNLHEMFITFETHLLAGGITVWLEDMLR